MILLNKGCGGGKTVLFHLVVNLLLRIVEIDMLSWQIDPTFDGTTKFVEESEFWVMLVFHHQHIVRLIRYINRCTVNSCLNWS